MPSSTHNPATQIGGETQFFEWNWQNRTYSVAYETRGSGSPILLLPAFSTVSSRTEMRGLAESLSTQFQVVALDWLGFGQSSRPALDYNPALYQQLLRDFVAATFDTPVAVVAAGHAAGYAMQVAQQQPCPWSKIVLVAPTWKGPLRVMGAPTLVRNGVRKLVRSPLLGQLLYKLNTLPSFLHFMYRRHVYTNPEHLTPEFMAQKWQITQQPGARYAPAAFVTGTLDPVQQRTDFLNVFQTLSTPVMVVIGEQTPPKSKAEMEVLAHLTGVQVQHMSGSLGLHEEYVTALAEVLFPFLQDNVTPDPNNSDNQASR
ncbi:MAG: alpha/beta fold hydrolase [Cyanobacteria bacterium CRU_2_1]|nr:alpha/beta fold hydrolase [Cyanobacteria bacterium CRU_2_1]